MIKKNFLLELLLVFIITIPAFFALFNSGYFTMHDDQHIVRLFLLDQGISQGLLYPRWVDRLGFGFGYPLFNFYPPLIYYIGELFHLLGFSLIVSIKLMIMTGFLGASGGMYLLAKKIMGKAAGFVTTILYTYFFYHSVTVYVRGAFAEFFTFAILPFVFLFLYEIFKKPSIKNSVGLGISFAALILTHPLIAFPGMIYIGLSIIFYLILLTQGHSGEERSDNSRILSIMRRLWTSQSDVRQFISHTFLGLLLGLGLSAFFWLPSILERKFTMVDSILLKELASYKIHFVEASQLWFSPWGYGGSVEGLGDGFTFQLGKIHILFLSFSFILSFIYIYYLRYIHKKKKDIERMLLYYFFFFLTCFSLFMTTIYSSIIWDNLHFLWYLQFPWRFLTFAAFFISLCGGFTVYFLAHIEERLNKEWILLVLSLGIAFVVIVKYGQYFRPQTFLETTDAQRTTDEEIEWRISRSSFEFVPKGVATKKSELNTTIFNIDKKDLPNKPFKANPLLKIEMKKNEFRQKLFVVDAEAQPGFLQLNTFNFPGWKAYINGTQVPIQDNNPYKLITLKIPKGQSSVQFYFENTPVRTLANTISLISFISVILYFAKRKFGSLNTS